ncbi:DNA-binding CsgD family transcriptional regulator/type II secretory pathway predicted ATPase ExeA [Arthrobacter ginsengisoli]|uniref:DNA-binding CsgD family transcriptional regulator/type II secretory pathway predicted ATPase ExeA n=1 Tax=Arthrobacter ginsengisoli TaxID=1356565 RepID=A0ABU1U838_9MICC|nr:DNA-binding CsgD family transcriptional regulator/type II secretory pathway predicted ATPase ExeA [Arthrobacter ginsengisoli]
MEAIQGGTHVAVLLLGDSGIGKSTLLDAVVAELESAVTPVRIHGSPSLANVPYGVLGPFIVGLPVQEATSQLAVLRTLWSRLEEERRASQKPLLLIVDDAHDLDESTAGILVELAAAGWAKLLVASATRPGLPEPLLQLWFEGIAERLDLRPLTQQQTAEILERTLGSQILPNVAEILWEASEGNPLLLNGLIDDAKNDGSLLQRNGVWLLARTLNSHGDRLKDVVRRQLLRRSPDERQALNLIALAEPVSRELIEATVGVVPVAALIEHELIRVTPAPHPQLRLWHSIYADTLRNLISPARSLQLRQSLLRLMDSEPTSAEGLLRQVSWSLECGAEVDDRQLLRAAVLASRLYEDELARKAAALVKDPELQVAARSVTARTYFNTSDYAAARDILEADFAKGRSVAVLLTGTLMWAAVQAALGNTPTDIMDRAGALLAAGERLARENPEEAGEILAAVRERYATMHAMVFALAGEYPDGAGTDPAVQAGPPDPPANPLEAAFRLALESERLLVQGKAVQSFAAASQALETAGTGHDDLYYLAEFLVARAAAAVIHGGDWHAADVLLAEIAAGPGPILISFGGGVHAAHGIILLYQGKAAQALNTLSAALESLRLADPQQLFALTASMAFAAAAEVGAKDAAAAFLADYDAAPRAVSRYLRIISQMAVIYGKARLGSYPGAIGELRALGRPLGDGSTPGLEFDSLAFCLALGDRNAASRLLELEEGLEGPRAAAICRYAAAISTDLPADHLEAGKSCEEAELWGFAALAYDAAANGYRSAGDTLRERMAMSQRKRCLDRADSVDGQEHEAESDALGLLTRRERDIVALAVRGLSDRQIAAELQVSIRTVEGHLYRSYAKLNVKGRDQLPGVSPS